LILDIEKPNGIPTQILSNLKDAANIMQKYLLGETSLSNLINNHAFFLTSDPQSEDSKLSLAIPIIRKSAGGYPLWLDDKFSAIIHNLGGFICVTHIQPPT